MTKNGLLLTSLVAAIPGAFLAYLMVMAFVNFAGGPTVWMKTLAVLLLLIGCLLVAMPVGIFLYAGPKTEKKPKGGEEAPAGEGESVAGATKSGAVSDSALAVSDSSLDVTEGGTDEFAMSDEFVSGGESSGEDFELGSGSDFEIGAAEGEAAAEDEIFDAEEEPPKKGKKK